MNFKWVGPIGLLAALVIGDQIRINRPGHKYRLAVEVETPEGVKSASGVLAVHPDRGYSRSGSTLTKGDAVWVDLGGGKNLLALLAHIDDKGLELDGMNYVALRAFNAAGRKTTFNAMNQMTGTAPVTGALIPVLATFTDINDPATMRVVKPDDLEATYGKGFRLRSVTRRGGAERFLAARFRRRARRAGDAGDRGEIAVVEQGGRPGGDSADGRGPAIEDDDRRQRSFHPEVT